MTKRTAPSAALVLAVALAASGPVLATKGLTTKIPEVITVSEVSVQSDSEQTEITLHGDFPLNYLVYQPERNKLVIEVRDCDASGLAVPDFAGSQQVVAFEAITDSGPTGAPISRFKFDLVPRVSHAIDPDGNNLIFRFVGGIAPTSVRADAGSDASPVVPVAAPAGPRPAATRAARTRDLPGFRQTDLVEFAEEAGLDRRPPARALVGVDTSRAAVGRVVLMLDGPATFSTFELTDPMRLVVDFESLVNEVPTSTIPVDSPFLHRLRVSQFKEAPERVARAVLDLSGPATYDLVPTQQGLEIVLARASLPALSDLEIAEADVAPAPSPVAALPTDDRTEVTEDRTEATEDRTTRAVIANGPAPDEPVDTEPAFAPLETAEEISQVGSLLAQADAAAAGLDPDDYAFYSLAEPDAATAAAAKAKPGLSGLTFESRTLSNDRPVYTGRRISLELVDADLKQIFRLFHDISGLNFVLDPSVDGKVTIVLDNVPWDQALDIILHNNGLDKVFENNVMRIASAAKLASEAQLRRALKEASRLEVDPVTVSRVLSYAKAEDTDQIIRRILSPRGQSFYDQRTNTLVITDIPEKIAEINALMDDLDARTPQVMIEARIVETSREFVRDLGIVWNLLVNDTTGSPNGFGEFTYDVNLPGKTINNLGISFGDFGATAATLNLTIDALELEGHARTLSAPRIAAQNNTKAVIEQGVQIPVVNTTATEINVEFISASLKLEVTPQITAEGTIIMDIKVDNSSPDFTNTIDDTPSIKTQRAETRVLIEDGGTTVIGGVFLLTEGESESGVPGLRKIPGLGWLFKKKNITKQNKELLIFITPKIMS